MFKQTLASLLCAFGLPLAQPALASISLQSNETGIFKFDFGSTTPLNGFTYRFNVTNPGGTAMNWYGSYSLSDELGSPALNSRTFSFGGNVSFASDFSLGIASTAPFATLFDDPISYITVSFFQGPANTDTTGIFDLTATVSTANNNLVVVTGEEVLQQTVPEPLPLSLIGLGLLSMLALRRRKR